MVKNILKWLFYGILTLIGVILLIFLTVNIKSKIKANQDYSLLGNEPGIIVKDGNAYRDLNKNGVLDIYENPEETIDARVNDLLNQMNIEEKAGLMFINMAAMQSDGSLANTTTITNPLSLAFESNVSLIAKKKMNHFNTLQSLTGESMIAWYNNMQKIAERTRLGIPMTLATDPRHGVENAPGQSIYTPIFSSWCSTLGLAAIGDTVLTREFGDIARQEYMSVGFRLALSPMADIATEPRWARINGTFGEDAQLVAKLTKAYILGFQGDTLGHQSVSCMVKHFSGGGPQKDGMDAHFPPGYQTYKGNNFEYHLIPFEQGAFPAKASQVMPYYGIPVGQTSEDVGFAFNKDIITGLLRTKYKFDGIICTDWGIITDVKALGITMKPAAAHGVENLSIPDRVLKVLDAGCDMLGGESLPDVLVELVQSGKISEDRINLSVKRILKEKFRLGLFDNPFLNPESINNLKTDHFIKKGFESQKRSLVLLKNDDNLLPLKLNTKVFLKGFDKEDLDGYNSVLSSDIKDADVIIIKVNTPYWGHKNTYIAEEFFHQGRLDFPEKERLEILQLMKSKPTIFIINLDRPAVFPDLNSASKAVVADFSSQDNVILDLIFGKFKPEGRLPFDIPSSMESVLKQKEDVPFDSTNPLYKFGDGMTYEN